MADLAIAPLPRYEIGVERKTQIESRKKTAENR
jgi:hypothetical protein